MSCYICSSLVAAVLQDSALFNLAAVQHLGVGEKIRIRKNFFVVMIKITDSVAVTDMIFGLIVKQQLAFEAEGQYIQNVRSSNWFSVIAHRVQ